MYYGYHRTSTTSQHLDRGIIAITEFCQSNNIKLTDIYTDQQTGKNFERPEYQFIRKRLLPGDTLIIAELDRLGRNKKGILDELRYFADKHIRVMILEIPTTLMDYSKLDNSLATMMMEAVNNMLIEMFAVFAETEIQKKEIRQKQGIEAKKLRGEWNDYGRPLKLDFELFCNEYTKVESGEITAVECRKRLGLSHTTFYRYRKKYIDERQ